jgi:hypothetical protein
MNEEELDSISFFIFLFVPPDSPASGQNLFYSFVLWFCWRENINDDKKDIVFLLVWDKDNYTEIPRVASMHLCIATHIGSSLPDLVTTSRSPSHRGLLGSI